MSDLRAVVAVYGTHIEAEEAVKQLQRGGIDIGKDNNVENSL
jgi:hypothetical protein